MAIYKVTVSFGFVNGSSFSETHFIEASNAFDAAVPGSFTYTNRCKMLHPQYTLLRVRASNVENNRDTSNVAYNMVGTFPITLELPEAEAPSTAAVITLAGKTGGSRRWWVRGCSTEALNIDPDDGQFTLTPKMVLATQAFLNSASSVRMGLRRLTPTANTSFNFIPIQSIARDASGLRSVLTLERAPGWAVGQAIIIYKVNQKDFAGLTGKFQVMAINNAAITINYTMGQLIPNPEIHGTVRAANYDTISIYSPNGYALHHIGEHKTKSPLFGSRGARRAQHLRMSR